MFEVPTVVEILIKDFSYNLNEFHSEFLFVN